MSQVKAIQERVLERAQRLSVDVPAELRLGHPIELRSLPAFDGLKAAAESAATRIVNALRAQRQRTTHSVVMDQRSSGESLHQVLPTMVPFDAVSNDALAIRSLLRTHGYVSEIYAEHVAPVYRGDIRLVDHVDEIGSAPIAYHVSANSPRAERALARHRGQVYLRYHNITPCEWFDGVSAAHQDASRKARGALRRLSQMASGAIADSAYNAEELRALEMSDVEVVPILLAPAENPPAWTGGGRYAISVGRIAPNKRIDFVLRTIAAYQQLHDPDFGLVLVGSDRGLERYGAACRDLERELGVRNVRWVGSVEEAEKLRLMAEADAYLCASDHEGFCVPIVESFRLGLPVVARATSAVTDTCGSALAVDTADPAFLANVLRVVVDDADLRTRLIATQHEEAKRFEPGLVGEQVLAWARAHVATA